MEILDGGVLSNGAENRDHCSYQLSNRDGRKHTIRLNVGTATNTEVDYRALVAALEQHVGRFQRADKAPSAYSLVVQTDSQSLSAS